MINEKWFLMSIEKIENKLKTNAASGLNPKAARSRAAAHRKDTPFFTVKKKRIDKLLLDLFSDIFLLLLTLLALLSLFFEGDVVIGSGILIVIAVNVGVSFLIYYRDRRTVESMTDFFSPTARVIRGGKLYVVDYRDLAEGDVIMIEKGDIIGCDARLIHSESLKVNMMIDKKSEKIIEKYAGSRPREDELYAENMSNMVHAGSTVINGNGRAIVTAVGKYTYLGAMTGGVTEIPSVALPEGLASLKKKSSRIGMVMLLSTLPFCIFSVLFGSFEGGTAVLSEAILLALSIGSCAMLSRSSTLFCHFYSRFIRRAAMSTNPCIIRSLEIFDKLADVDYLFLLDGSIATDGVLHFESMITADGEVVNPKQLGQTSNVLAELIVIYYRARMSAPSVGVKSNDRIDAAMAEFVKKSAIDTEASKIRYLINSYLPGIDKNSSDIVSFSEQGQKRELNIATSGSFVTECSSVMVAGVEKPLSDEGKKSLSRSFEGYVATGRHPVCFSLGHGDNKCFIGMIVLCEGTDPSLVKAVSAVRKTGISIISFSNCPDRINSPEIPDLLRRGKRVYKDNLLRAQKDVTYSFGDYDEYCGFYGKDISKLVDYAHKQGKKTALYGFTDFAAEAIEKSDIYISCAPVRTGVFGHFSEEIRSLEVPGEQSSTSCTQTVRSRADILLTRPQNSKGGLGPLATAVGCCRLAYRNLSNFLRYFVFANLIRLVAAALPMMFGQTYADARQMLVLGLGMDVFAMMIFSMDHRRGSVLPESVKKDVVGFDLMKEFKSNGRFLISSLIGALLCLILPNILGSIGVFGKYYYRAEYTFIAISLVQVCLFACVYVKDLLDVRSLKKLFGVKLFLIELVCIAAFILVCLVTPVGKLFGIVSIGFAYLVLSLFPATAFIVSYIVMGFALKKKNGKKSRKM